MTVFPASETRKVRQKATVFAIFAAVKLQQLDVSFIVVFKFSDIVVQFLHPPSRSRNLILLTFLPVSLFMFHRRRYNCWLDFSLFDIVLRARAIDDLAF